MYEAIDYTVEGPIATITLNRPDRLNAITGQMIKEIQDAIGRADADERVVGYYPHRFRAGLLCRRRHREPIQELSQGGSFTAWEMGNKNTGPLQNLGRTSRLTCST